MPAGRRPSPGQRVRYRYHFTDFVSGLPLATLPVRDAKLSEVLSGASDATGVVPLTSDAVLRSDPFRATIPRRSCIWAERRVLDTSRRTVSVSYPWGGVILGRERSKSGRSLAFSAVSWPGYFARRITRTQSYPATTDKFAVFRGLLADAVTLPYHVQQQYPNPGQWPADPYPLQSLPYSTSNLSGVKTEQNYVENDLRSTLEDLESLGRSGDGFDWRMYPVRDSSERFRVGLALGYPRLGRVASRDLVWTDDENDTNAGVLLDYKIAEDGSGVNNRLVGVGEGQGPTQLRAEVTSRTVGVDELDGGYPLWESAARGSSGDLRTMDALAASLRGSMIAGLLSGTRLSGVKVRGDLAPTLDRYEVGDDGTFRLGSTTTGRPVTMVGQIVGRTIEPPQQGRPERVTLDVMGAVA